MKKLLYLSLIPFIAACSSGTESSTEDTSSNETESTETAVSEGTIDRPQMESLQGTYFALSQEGGDEYYKEGTTTFYQEACNYQEYDYRVFEETEYSDEWRITIDNEFLSVISTEEKEGSIYVNTDDDRTFIFAKTSNNIVLEFMELGMKGSSAIVNTENVGSFETKACTDTDAIMASLPTQWHYVTVQDGVGVLYIPCEEAPGMIRLEDGHYDNGSGVDPYQIVSMAKINNTITIEYQSLDGDSESLTMKLAGETMEVGDDLYVSEQAKETYDEVSEEC